MICGKMTMKYGKVWKYDLEVVEKYDGKEGIFKAQQISTSILNSPYTCFKSTCKKPTTTSLIFHCHGSKESTYKQFMLVN